MSNTYQNNLGKSIELTANTYVTNQYEPIAAKGNFAEIFDTRHEMDCSEITIFNIATWIGNYTPADEEVVGRHLAILGRVEWGIGNASFSADFDWKMGTQLSIPATFVRISAAYSEVGPATPSVVRIGAMLSSGSRAARSQVTRSYPQLIFNVNNIVLFPIPPFAHALNLFSSDPEFYEAGDVRIRYAGGASAGFSATTTDLISWESDGVPFLDALANEDGVRFPETARFVELSTETAAQDYHVTPTFTLSL